MFYKVLAWAFLIATTTISLAIVTAIAGFSWGVMFMERIPIAK